MTFNDLIYRLVRPFGGLQLAKYLARRHPRILMYHRVALTPAEGAIGVDQFRQQMRTIKRELNPISLEDLISANDRNIVPKNAIVITFDDGYADFYQHVLKEEGIPCTLFVTTGFVNGDIWLWPDRLRFCVDKSLQESIRVPGQDRALSLSGNQQAVWNALADHCLTLSSPDKARFIESVATELGVSPPHAPPLEYQALNWDQVREITRSGFTIGSHSVTHPIMTSLDDASLKFELTESKAEIERQIERPVNAFCYPNGQPFDFDERVKTAVHAAGYQCALAAFPGRNTLGDRLAIHRYPGSLSAAMFEKTVFGFSYLRLPRNA